MENLQNLPIGVQDFTKIRQLGYFYVDKTDIVYRMANGGSYYFLSRPRRFGKSLLLSTLRAYFEGRKELFAGLKIDALEHEWTSYPVLYLDLNAQKYTFDGALDDVLNVALTSWEAKYGRNEAEVGSALRFCGVIQRAYEKTGQRVVILVDEYDKPMLQTVDNQALQQEYRDTLKAFYSALKSMDGCIKFALLTGITKFAKVSIFSDLNNLKDISMDRRYIDVCGITADELNGCLSPYLARLADNLHATIDKAKAALKQMYDGYHFADNTKGLYNPFSLLSAFDGNQLGSFWFESGTPTYIVKLLQKHEINLERLSHSQTTADVLNSPDIISIDPIPLLYQSGYLTIKDYDPRFKSYQLGFPNDEVVEGFMKFLMPFYTNFDKIESPFQIKRVIEE